MTTFWAVLFRANEINGLAHVKSSIVVFFAKNVVIFGVFLTTPVVIADSPAAARFDPGPHGPVAPVPSP
jgi:hypothetical protein